MKKSLAGMGRGGREVGRVGDVLGLVTRELQSTAQYLLPLFHPQHFIIILPPLHQYCENIIF